MVQEVWQSYLSSQRTCMLGQKYMAIDPMTGNEIKMYQIIEGETIQVVRWGEELLPVTNPLTREIVGQLALKLEVEVEN